MLCTSSRVRGYHFCNFNRPASFFLKPLRTAVFKSATAPQLIIKKSKQCVGLNSEHVFNFFISSIKKNRVNVFRIKILSPFFENSTGGGKQSFAGCFGCWNANINRESSASLGKSSCLLHHFSTASQSRTVRSLYTSISSRFVPEAANSSTTDFVILKL